MSPPLTEFLYACYFGFYLFFLVPPFLFLRAGGTPTWSGTSSP